MIMTFTALRGSPTAVLTSAGGRSRGVVKPLSVFRFALSVFRSETGPPGVPVTPGCSGAFAPFWGPPGGPGFFGPPQCSGLQCERRPYCSVLLLAILARVTLKYNLSQGRGVESWVSNEHDPRLGSSHDPSLG